jgi:hypothetical protein
MNERIKELAIEAGYDMDMQQHQKFAELIVKKCMELTKRCSTGKGIHDLFADEIIKEHFGVEE